MSYPSYYRYPCTELLGVTEDYVMMAYPGKGEDETVLCQAKFDGQRTRIVLTRKEALAFKRFLECLEPTTQAEVEQIKREMVERAGAK